MDNLKRELHEASDEVRHKKDGITKLEQINQNLSENGPFELDVAREKVSEMKEVKEQLLIGQQEKIRILEELLRQRDECQISELNKQVNCFCSLFFYVFFYITKYWMTNER